MGRITIFTAVLGLACLAGCASTPGHSGFGATGAPWTIRCAEFQGPLSMQHAEQVSDTLRRTKEIRSSEVLVCDASDGSTGVYYGVYHRRTNRKTGKVTTPPRMREDLKLIAQLGDSSGRRYFSHALPVRMPQPDVGPAEWNLAHVDAKYSLQVAAFEPNDQFWEYKRAAAEYCEFLRKRGYEAYYHHSSSSSVVTVGRFGSGAVRTDKMGRNYYSQEVRELQKDELLRYNLVNAAIIRVRTGPGETVPVPSRLVEVPRAQPDD